MAAKRKHHGKRGNGEIMKASGINISEISEKVDMASWRESSKWCRASRVKSSDAASRHHGVARARKRARRRIGISARIARHRGGVAACQPRRRLQRRVGNGEDRRRRET